MSKRLVLIFIALLLSSPSAFAADQFPKPTGFINDYAGVLTPQEKQQLTELSQTLEAKTGAELAVAIVKSVAPLDSKMYAVKLFENWKIGKKGKDNGLLILLAMDERRIEIEVGYGLEGVINDALAGQLLDQYAIPKFKEGKYGEGVYQTAAAVAVKIAAAAKQDLGPKYESAKQGENEDWTSVIITSVIILFILVIFIKFSTSGKFTGGGWSGWGGSSSGGGGFGGGGSGGGGSGRSW